MSENIKSKSNFVAPLTKIYREKIKKNKEVKPQQSSTSQHNNSDPSKKEQNLSGGNKQLPNLIEEEKISPRDPNLQAYNSNPQGWGAVGSNQGGQPQTNKLSQISNFDPSSVQGIKQGFIKKYVNMVRGSKKRYFVLTPELLIYYKDKKGQVSEKGQISLKLAKIDPRTMNDKKMVIGTGMSEIFLEFATVQEKKEWLMAIDDCKKRLNFNLNTQGDSLQIEDGADNFDSINKKSFLIGPQELQEVNSKQIRKSSIMYNQHNERKSQLKESQGLDFEIKMAINAALQSNIIKEDSQLSIHLASTWQAQLALEEVMNKFKTEFSQYEEKFPSNLIKLGQNIESISNDLKQSVTSAIQAVEKTKLKIIKILEVQDEMLKKKASVIDEKGYLGEDSKFISFSQEFNDLVEHKRDINDDLFEQADSLQNVKSHQEIVMEQIRQSRFSRPSLMHKIDAIDEDDDFFDAVGDQQTLEIAQQEIVKPEEVELKSYKEEEQDYRTILPALKPPDQKVSVWKVIKDAIGKDITRFCVPVYFNEPISMLQKVSEIMEYESLLVKAADEKDSLRRLLYVAAFGVAQYKCSDKRLCKPFNPILGETFELKRPNYLFFSEQVSHHPPVSACFSQSDSYEFWMNTSMKTNFWGKSLEIKPFGYQNVKLKTTNERFTIERPSSSVNNLIFGEMYVEHSGVMTVKNLDTHEYVEIDFKKRGWGGKSAYEIEGFAFTPSKQKKWKLYGKWIESISVKSLTNNEEYTIWQANPMPKNFESMYNFTYFTLQLNYLPPGLKERLPLSDSRFRPDQRALEEGDLIKAASEKARLEDKQRKMRKEREQTGDEYKSLYFEEYVDPQTEEKGYKYIRDYWEDRKNGNWSHIQDLF